MTNIEVLKQLAANCVADGDLASKHQRDALVKAGYVIQALGLNFLTLEGVRVAHALGLLPRNRPAPRQVDYEVCIDTGVEIVMDVSGPVPSRTRPGSSMATIDLPEGDRGPYDSVRVNGCWYKPYWGTDLDRKWERLKKRC